MQILSHLKHLDGRNCVTLESGIGMAVKVLGFFNDGEFIAAKLKLLSNNGFTQNRTRLKNEPFIKEWWNSKNYLNISVGEVLEIETAPEQIICSENYVYFGLYGAGGVRMFFYKEYVDKVINNIDSGWDELSEKCEL